jgi:pyridoxine 4-dehydrogenase
MPATAPGGTVTLAEDLTLSRMGYGAMQLAGRPGVFGPPNDPAEAAVVLQTAVELGITHIDTADFYGPGTVNDVIRAALAPYPAALHIVTKVGAQRGADKSWSPALSPAELTAQVHDNLEHLGLDVLDVVNLRQSVHAGPDESIAEPFGVLAELRDKGLIRHLGLSGVTDAQLTEAQRIAPVVTVQNAYNLALRDDDELVDRCARDGIAFAPFFPLGGFTALQSDILDRVAAQLAASPQQVALAWLLRRSPTMTVIPGTASVAHLRENVAAAGLVLPADALAELDTIGQASQASQA